MTARRPLGRWPHTCLQELLPDAWTAARAMEYSAARARALGPLAPHLPAERRAEGLADALDALTAARASADGYTYPGPLRTWPRTCLAELLADTLTAARRVRTFISAAPGARVLVALAPHLLQELLADAR